MKNNSESSKTTVDGEVSVWNGAYNMSGSVEYAEKWDEMALRATLNQMAVMAVYDVKLHRHGFATISIVDLDGSEWLYSHGEASMGNGSALVRFKGNEVVAASTTAAFFGSDASKTTVDGEVSVWNGAYNMSGSVE